MHLLPWLSIAAPMLVIGDAGSALVARQYDGAAAASSFLRRGYHASLVAGNFVYIDGGEFSTHDHGNVAYEYSNTLLAIDLSKNWTNSTATLHSTTKPSSVPSLDYGGLWYDESADVLYTGFVVLGGVETNPETDALDWGAVTVFDPQAGRWYDQETTGNVPLARKEFCAAGLASDNRTYEIFVYAGWGGDLGTQSVQYDQIYILTLPAFHWIKVDYNPTGTRHALTCHAVGGGQILTIGGVNSASTDSSASIYQGPFRDRDKYTQGLAVFDMSTLDWKDGYNANATRYTQSSLVRTYYAQNGRNPTFNSTALKTVFDTANFTDTDTASTNTPSGSSPSASAATAAQSSKSLTKGAVAGIAVGAVVGALAFIGGLLFLGHARKRRARKATEDHQRHLINASAPMPEMHAEGISELPPDGRRRVFELNGAAEHMAHEKDGTNVPAELPADEAERRKSGRIR